MLLHHLLIPTCLSLHLFRLNLFLYKAHLVPTWRISSCVGTRGNRSDDYESLQFAVVGKFSYGWSKIHDLRKMIPTQCELKGDCQIGLLSSRHVLIRASLLNDYVHLLSKFAFYITQRYKSFPMRIFKWDPSFDLDEETTTTVTWISFPTLPPTFSVNQKFSHWLLLASHCKWILQRKLKLDPVVSGSR